MAANETQIGGSHYKRGDGREQHWDFIARHAGVAYHIANATKYLERWREKNGVQDLQKALHYIAKTRELVEAGAGNPFTCTMEDVVEFTELLPVPEQVAMDALFRFKTVEQLDVAKWTIEAMIKNEEENAG